MMSKEETVKEAFPVVHQEIDPIKVIKQDLSAEQWEALEKHLTDKWEGHFARQREELERDHAARIREVETKVREQVTLEFHKNNIVIPAQESLIEYFNSLVIKHMEDPNTTETTRQRCDMYLVSILINQLRK